MAEKIVMRYLTQDSDFTNIYMKMPKALIYEEMFAILDNDDKIAYSFMLDRAMLSVQNGWIDSAGRVFIYFTVEEACRVLGVGRTKIAKIFKKLVHVGLVERVAQGLGKPVIIYVKSIIVENEADMGSNAISMVCGSGFCKKSESDQIIDSSDRLADGESSEKTNQSSGGSSCNCDVPESHGSHRRPHDKSLDDRETAVNKTDINNTECNSIISLINPICNSAPEKKPDKVIDRSFFKNQNVEPTGMSAQEKKCDETVLTSSDEIENNDRMRKTIRGLVHRHIDYSCFEDFRPDDLPMVDDIVELMTDVIMTDDSEIVISRIPRNGNLVRQSFLLMKFGVIEYVIDSVKRVTTRIRNMRQYLLTSLYNATDTFRIHRAVFS